MREEIIKVYKFDELAENVQEKVLEKYYDINVDYEWWQFVYEDAENVGLKIEEFDISRGAYCRGKWSMSGIETAEKILKEHGENCETYQDAEKFLYEVKEARKEFESNPEYDPEYEEFEDTGEYDDMENEFRRTICEDYRRLLEKEYEWLTSEEAIVETIKANEYEFTADGELY